MTFENSMEPYAQLVRSLLPDAIAQIESSPQKKGDGDGQHCALADDGPAYLFWLRDANASVAAIVAVVCNRLKVDADVLPFSYVLDHLRPALELLRRDLL